MTFRSMKRKPDLAVKEKMLGMERARRAIGGPNIFSHFLLIVQNYLSKFYWLLSAIFCNKNIVGEELLEDDQYE